MKIIAEDLKNLNIIDKIIPEKQNPTDEDKYQLIKELKQDIIEFIDKNKDKSKEEIVNERYSRFRNM